MGISKPIPSTQYPTPDIEDIMTTTTKSPDTKNSGKTTLFIADDHPVVLEGVRMSFEKEADFQILGTASDGVQAVQEVKRLNPEIVIMDIGMPRMRGMDAAQEPTSLTLHGIARFQMGAV